MHYLGGKFRIRKQVAAAIQPFVTERYFEPFCGSAWVGELIQAPVRVFSDSHPELIALWNAVLLGWHPPEHVSEQEYGRLKDGGGPPHLRGFVGFGCSYSGKWFGGYARNSRGDNYAGQASRSLVSRTGGERNYAGNARNQLIGRSGNFANSHFLNFDYRDIFSLLRPGDVAYCDPPYRGTTRYKGVGDFDHDEFWSHCRATAQSGVHLFISEYSAPKDFKCALEIPTRTGIRTNERSAQDRVERLFTLT
jgi:DNA adenine methylase